MKTLTIVTAFVLISAGHAMAQSGTPSTASQAVAPQAAPSHVMSYNIVEAKVAEGVKYQNPGKAKGVSQQPGKLIFKALPTRG